MNKRIFTTLVLSCGLLAWSGVSAQQNAGQAQPASEQNIYKDPGTGVKAFSHLSAALEFFSTTGFGLEAATPLNAHFALRGGFSLLPYKYSDTFNVSLDQSLVNNIVTTINGNQAIYDALIAANLPTTMDGINNVGNVDATAKLGMVNGKLLADYYPWKKFSFHLTGGFYFGSNKLVNVNGTMKEAFRVLDILKAHGYDFSSDFENNNEYGLTVDDVRNVNAYMKINAIKPYVGLGFGRAVPKHRVGFNFDLGALYWGTPKLKSDNPRVQKMMDDNLGDAADVLKDFSFYPVMSFKVNVRIF